MIKLKPSVKRLVFLCFLLPIQVLFAQQAPSVSFPTRNYAFTKGVSVSGFSAPTNSGGSVPATVSGNVVGSFGIGVFDAYKIAKSGDGNLISTMFNKGTVERVSLTSNAIQSTLSNRDKPWGVVKDSQGNVYWTETGSYKIVANPKQADETSYAIGALDFLGAVGLPGKAGDALEVFNGARELYSAFSGGDDLVRKISGQNEKAPYILKFSGKIYKLAAGSSSATVFASDIQMPTGLAIDENDNLYVSCYTAKFTVQGGLSFAGGAVSKVDDVSDTYSSKILKIAPDKSITNIGSFGGVDYPTSLGIDRNGNLSMMFYTDNFQKVKVLHILKYPVGQTTGKTYESAKIVVDNSTVYQDLVVDGPGNIYLSDFYNDKIFVHPIGSAKDVLSVFSDNVTAPKALYVDLATNQLWAKEGKYINTGTINKLNLYGYSVSPTLPNGLFLTTEGKVSGTPKVISAAKNYTITASNSYGTSNDIISITINQIVAPNINYTVTNHILPLGASANIAAPTNSGGAFNQQVGPVKVTNIYTHPENYKKMGGFAFDANGNMYFALFDEGKIMKLTPSGQSSVLLSGLQKPKDILIDPHSGNLYFSEWDATRVKLLAPGFSVPIEVIKTGSPAGLSLTDDGILYIASAGNSDIDKFDIKKNTVSDGVKDIERPIYLSIYDGQFYVRTGDGGIYKIPVSNPSSRTKIVTVEQDAYHLGMTLDDFGNIYYADYNGFKKIPVGSSTPEVFAIPGVDTYGSNKEIKTDADNNIYISVSSYKSSSIYKVINGGYTVSPALPAGLVLNDNGTISGTPTAITAAKNYTITAINSKGSSSKVLNISVVNLPTTNIQYAGFPKVYNRGIAIAEILPTITGGKPDNFTITPTLPTGLVFETSTGKISGTATVSKLATGYTITANNTAGSASTTISIAVTEVPPSALSYAFASNKLQRDVHIGNVRPTITGGTGIMYVISPTLPTGLTFDPATGIITGKPTSITASKTYSVTATNNGGSTSTSFALEVILDPPTNLQYTLISNNLLRDKAIGNISPTFDGAGISSFSISPALPAGLSFNTTTGIISGTPTSAIISKDYTITATNDGGTTTRSISLAVYVAAPTNLSYVFASNNFLRNNAITTVVPTYDGSPATSFSIAPALPAGLSFNTSTGAVSGTPTAIATIASYTVTATNEAGNTTKAFSLGVYVKAPTNLNYVFVSNSILRDKAFANVTPTYEAGSQAAVFTVNPTLPTGLSINATTGIISGMPTAITANTNYTVTATNDGGSVTKVFALAVRVDRPINIQYNFAHTELLKGYAIPSVTPTYEGSVATTFSINTPLPTGLNFNIANGVISGTPSDLTAQKTYTVTIGNDGGSSTKSFDLKVTELAPTGLTYTLASNNVLRDEPFQAAKPTYTGGSVTSFTVSPALPTGLVLNSATGVISGTPSVIKTNTSYTVTGSNSVGNTTYSFFLAVRVDPPINLDFVVDHSFIRNTAIVNIVPTYSGSKATFTVNPTLPAGLIINATTGVVSGTPTAIIGRVNYTITATNDGGSAQKVVWIDVRVDPPTSLNYVFESNSLLRNNAIANLVPTYTQGSHTATFTVNPALPVGLALNATTGVIFGTPTAITASRSYTISATNDGGSATKVFTWGVRVDPPTNFRYSFQNNELVKDIAIDKTTPRFSGSPTNIFSISPSLPAGLNFNTSNGEVTGTPTALKSATEYTVTATNDGGSGVAKFTLAIANIPIPEISYAVKNYRFTKGVAITTIDAPANTGNAFPQQRVNATTYTGISSATGVATNKDGDTFIAYFEAGEAKIKMLAKGTKQITEFLTSGISTGAPIDIAVDYANNLYVTAGGKIKKITPAKLITDFDASLTGAYRLHVSVDNDLYVTYGGSILKYENCNPALKSTPISGMDFGSEDVVVDAQQNIYTLRNWIPANQPNHFMEIYKYYAIDDYNNASRVKIGNGVDDSRYMAIDKRGNIYINGNHNGGHISVFNGYTRNYVTTITNSLGIGRNSSGISLDQDQNLFYAIDVTSGTADEFGVLFQFGYNITSLPAGLVLNEDGTITGTPTNLQNETNHQVSAKSFYGTSNTNIKIAVVDAIPAFTYTDPNQVLTKSVTNVDLTPVSTGGTATSFSIKGKQLPSGITFNTATGIFTGKANLLQDTISNYTVYATNTGGTSEFNITLKIVDSAPTNLVYATNHVLTKDKSFENILPQIAGGPVTKYSVTPALPAGLYLNIEQGIIGGQPISTQAVTAYTIRAENTGGFVTATINITVNDIPPVVAYVVDKFRFKKGLPIVPIDKPASSGGPILGFSISGLPAGLSLNNDGTITGTPTQITENTEYELTANGGVWGNGKSKLSIQIFSLPPDSISYNTPYTMRKGTAIQDLLPTFTTSVGDPVTKFTVSPSLPAGLSINETTGKISGTPTDIFPNPGQMFYVYAENGAGKTYAPVVFILKDLFPVINYDTENVFVKGNAVSKSATSTGGVVTKYEISPSLPDGLVIDSLTGVIDGTSTALQVRTKHTITATNYGNPSATKDIYITVNDKAPIVSYNATNNFIRTMAITSLSPTSTGGGVVGYSISPALPQGLSLNTTTGVISGTPTLSTVSGNYTITAQNTGGSVTAIISISVKNAAPIVSYSDIVFTKGVAITDFEPSSTGGNQITFSISPALPAGLSFNTSTGVVSGTPTSITTQASYTVTATNDGGSQTPSFKITVNDKLSGDISYNAINQFYVDYAIINLTPTIGAGGGVIINYAITPTLPAGLSFNTTTGIISGTPTVASSTSTYTVTVSNSGGSKQATLDITVVKLDATISKTDVNCNGGSDGTAKVTVTGGQAPFSYSWSPSGGTAATASGLNAGIYTLTIKDVNNSSITRSVTIGQPIALTATISSTVIGQKNGSNGTATVSVSGGTAPYTYSWSPSGGTASTATGLTEGTYKVTITDAHSCQLEKSIFVDAPPAAPLGLAATSGNTQNILNWTANSESDIVSYKIYGSTNSNPTTLINTVSTPNVAYTHIGLTNGTTYYYKIVAVDGGGNESAFTSIISATPKTPQTITFNQLADKVYGTTDYDAGATTTSGLAITYSSSNTAVATIVAGKIHIVGVGSTIITASQSGDGVYFSASNQLQNLAITKKIITASLAGTVSKTYDGNTQASLTSGNYTLSGIEVGDVVTLNNPTSGTYDNKNKGTDKSVNITGLTISGTDVANYQLSSPSASAAIGIVTPKSLTVTASGISKTYDANTNATVTLSDNRVTDDVLTTAYTAAIFDNKNVGAGKTVSVSGISIGGTDAVNYTANTTASTTAGISAKALSITATGVNKTYDGNTMGTVTLIDNRVSGDVLTTAYTTATFDNKNVSTGKTVSVSGISISGTDAANYAINTTTNTTADVSVKVLNITAIGVNKVYDGNTTGTVTLIDNRVSGDVLTTANNAATFDNKNIGTGKTVSVSGISISGTDAANYTANTTTSTTATITVKTLNVVAVAKTKTYADTDPTLTYTSTGVVGTDGITGSLTRVAGENVNSYIISQGSVSAGSNYNINFTTANFTITPKTLNVVAVAKTKIYGDVDPTLTYTSTGIVGTDGITGSLTRAVGQNVGTYIISQGSVTAGSNYVINFTSANLVINKATLTISANNQVRCFGQSNPSFTLSYTGFVGVDNSTNLSAVPSGNTSANANSIAGNYVITVSGGISNNYSFVYQNGELTVNALPVVAISAPKTDLSKGETTMLTATGGVSYVWSNANGIISGQNTAVLTIRPTENATYTVTATNGSGCSQTASVTIMVETDYKLDATNALSPNGDGINDFFIIKNIDLYPNNELKIFDNAGRVFYNKKGYDNTWNGMLNGTPLPEGTYYYVLYFADNIGIQKGFITIIK